MVLEYACVHMYYICTYRSRALRIIRCTFSYVTSCDMCFVCSKVIVMCVLFVLKSLCDMCFVCSKVVVCSFCY